MSRDVQPVLLYADGAPISLTNPLPTTGGGGGGGGIVDQGKSNADATVGWSTRLTDGAAFITPAKTGQFPTALGATTAAGSLAVGLATDQISTLATSALQNTANTTLSSVLSQLGGLPTALGQTVRASSLSIALASDQVGTAGAANTQVLTVQGIASMTPIQVAQATATALNATARVTDGTSTAAVKAANAAPASADAALVITQNPVAPAHTAALTFVSSSATSVTLLAASTTRKSASFFNTSSADLYLREDGGVADTTTGFTAILRANGGYFELPIGARGTITTDAITGIWTAAGSGGCAVTQRT